MTSGSRTIAVLLAAFMLGGCLAGTLPPDAGTRPPGNEAVSPTEPGAGPSDLPTVRPSAAMPTPRVLTATAPLSDLPVCSDSEAIELGLMELAFVADWNGNDDVYTIRADGSDRSQLTNNPGDDVDPVWSQDGQQIAFVIDALTDPRLYISTADGSAGGIVAPDLEVTTAHVDMSPTGDLVAFRNQEDLYVVDTRTGEQTLVTRGADINPGNPLFSPSGTMLVFEADDPSGNNGLFVVNVDGTGLRELRTELEDVARPVWHPKQDKILFEGLVSSEGFGLYVATLDGNIEKLPIVPRYGASSAAWSPDGSMIGYIFGLSVLDSSGELLQKNSLHIATAEGDLDLELVSPPDEPDAGLSIHEIAWAPDSRHIAYSAVTEGRTDLFVLNICDGSSSLVVEGVDFYSTPSWKLLP